ncbi:hypothetical protein QSH39_019755 [Xanthomonas arboricola pv. corylina]|uniref:hypothetical protein n=1 Tax=Xanthomonas arboricola TaxID=56448 RepID=UPI000CEEC63A|nr:hypothetical protein [Xanthomonas arboricola]MDN0205053.1 hypothetical protein [Xanthomonas arboricola pv. corylina]MDN0218000.1 hypothetical protein [Xanthomonas arboricola pv. corylina]PPU56174.1 hypothetical protein XacyCFBP1159_20385 [Xanthomonas arboricola pv. corylina]
MEVSPPWTCDECGKPILSVEDGWVEWLNGSRGQQWEGTLHRLRLVHYRSASPYADRRNACYHDEKHWFAAKKYTVSDLPLSEFTGPDGLVTLLAFLADKRFAEPSEVLELIKRLYVPNYEATRLHFDAAIANGVFEPRTAPSYYDQEEMRAVLNWVREQEEQA